ncbi:MAG: hypothetical protein KAW92_00610 [Candidatus Cloacimonetes bacterium]|nr:hypothetical protein [Candidatus Cloacimonadota bacterium]
MGKMAIGYGSEFHLLRLLGRHRKELNKAIRCELKISSSIDWLDFPYNKKTVTYDGEYIGVDFLEIPGIEKEWEKCWPSKKNAMNWDAIAKVEDEWLLFEAKAHAGELKSNSVASNTSQIEITKSFKKLASKRGIKITNDWLKQYYQKANRLLFLHFLHDYDIKAKLVFIYFINGYEKDNKSIKSKNVWMSILKKQNTYLNITTNEWVKDNVFNVFIDAIK